MLYTTRNFKLDPKVRHKCIQSCNETKDEEKVNMTENIGGNYKKEDHSNMNLVMKFRLKETCVLMISCIVIENEISIFVENFSMEYNKLKNRKGLQNICDTENK